MASVLTVSVDIPEQRVQTDAMSALVDGRGWDMINSDPNVFVDIVTQTAMLFPLPYTSDWLTTTSGAFARFHKADYNLITPTKWTESVFTVAGDVYLHALNTNEIVSTNLSFPRNRAMYLGWHSYNSGNAAFVQLEAGWIPDNPTDPDIRLRFWANGKCDIYKNLVFVGEGNIFQQPSSQEITAYSNIRTTHRSDSKNLEGQTVSVTLIPCRRRELLVLSNQGGGFVFRFDDLDENDPSPTITGAGKFFWYVPQGQATVQFAPLNFRTAASIVSRKSQFRIAPAMGSARTDTPYFDGPGYGSNSAAASLRQWDGATNFAQDGTQKQCRLRVDLTGDGLSTPFVYGASSVIATQTAMTPNAPTLLDNYLLGASPPELSVPESPADVSLKLTLRNPARLETDGLTGAAKIGNRSVLAKIGTVAIFQGRTKSPKLKESFNDDNSEITLECQDLWKTLANYRFRDPVPLDGLNLTDALKKILRLCGFTDAQMDIENFDFPLPSIAGNSIGEFALLPEVGDTAAQWITRLWSDFARNCWHGFRPYVGGFKFYFKSPAGLGNSPVMTLYSTHDDAYAYLKTRGFTDADAELQCRFYTYQGVSDETVLECEANDITVVGRDPRTLKPLIVHFADTASQDPTIGVGGRPDNWLGEPRRYGLVRSSITSLSQATYCLSILRQRLVPVRRIREWESQFALLPSGVPLWRSDVVNLDKIGLFRVNTLSGTCEIEHAQENAQDANGRAITDSFGQPISIPERIHRPFRYTGEFISA